MSLTDRAREARERAETSTDPWDHRLAAALTAAEDAVAGEQLAELTPESDLTGIPKWSEVSKPAEVERGPYTPDEC